MYAQFIIAGAISFIAVVVFVRGWRKMGEDITTEEARRLLGAEVGMSVLEAGLHAVLEMKEIHTASPTEDTTPEGMHRETTPEC